MSLSILHSAMGEEAFLRFCLRCVEEDWPFAPRTIYNDELFSPSTSLHPLLNNNRRQSLYLQRLV